MPPQEMVPMLERNHNKIQEKISAMYEKHKDKIPQEFSHLFQTSPSQPTAQASPNVFIVRHGSTALNEKGALRGWADVPLSEEGVKQAEGVAKYLKDVQGITKIYTSDLQRCQRTADFIGKETGVKPIGDSGLRPINFGDLNGEPMKVVSPIMDDFNNHWVEDPNYKAHGSESFTEFQNRNLSFLKKALDTMTPQDKIVLVGSLRNCALFLSFIIVNSHPPTTTANLAASIPLQGQSIHLMEIMGQEPGSVSELMYYQGQLSYIRNVHP